MDEQREPELTALATATARRQHRSPEPRLWPGLICTEGDQSLKYKPQNKGAKKDAVRKTPR